jgi:anti-sigma factor RsiW
MPPRSTRISTPVQCASSEWPPAHPFSPQVDSLAALGFSLGGGRLDYLAGRSVAALVYQRQQHTIHIFEWPASDSREALTDTRALRGFQVRHWTRDGMAFWAVSDLNDIELDQFTQALHQ